MVITVDADNQVLISAFDSENGLKVEMLSPSSDPNDGSYGYRNYYNPEESNFTYIIVLIMVKAGRLCVKL